jgi:hypothetical protein
VFKVGSAIKGDITRLKKQFPQLAEQTSFNTIDLKEYAIQRGIILQKQSGTGFQMRTSEAELKYSVFGNIMRSHAIFFIFT